MGNAISKCREQKAECSAHFISKHFIYFTYSNNNVVRHRMLHFLYDLGLQLKGHYDRNGNMCRVLCAKFMIHARLERAYCNFTKYPKTSNAKTKRSKQIEMVLTDGMNKRTIGNQSHRRCATLQTFNSNKIKINVIILVVGVGVGVGGIINR